MTGPPQHGVQRRPWHLWVVGLVGLAWSGFAAFDYLMTVTRNEAYMSQFPKEMQDYFYALPWWYYAVWAVGFAGGILGCIALIARHRGAVPLLLLSLGSAIFSLICGLTDPNAPTMPGMEIMAALILGISVLLVAYAYVMTRRGVPH